MHALTIPKAQILFLHASSQWDTCCWATSGAYTHTQRRACTLIQSIQSQYLSHKHPHTPLQARPPPFASDTSQVGLLSDGESGLKEPVGFKRKTVSKEKKSRQSECFEDSRRKEPEVEKHSLVLRIPMTTLLLFRDPPPTFFSQTHLQYYSTLLVNIVCHQTAEHLHSFFI